MIQLAIIAALFFEHRGDSSSSVLHPLYYENILHFFESSKCELSEELCGDLPVFYLECQYHF